MRRRLHRVAWEEVKQTMSFREEIIVLASQPGANVREICRRFQVSAKTFYKWVKRARSGNGSLENRSRRPRKSPRQTSAEMESKILQVRHIRPGWGARKIRRVLRNQGEARLPATSTVHRILQRTGQIDPTQSQKHQAWQRFEHEAPNQLWQMDLKGWFTTLDQRRCNPLTVLDDHSRYAVCLRACVDQRTETVQHQLIATFQRYGLPERMTMDNGSPWGDDWQHPYTPLTVWLIRLGIRISHSRPFHPQTQGKDERFHRTLEGDLLRWHRFRDLDHVQRHFDDYRHVYNHERPHQALGLEVPASRYRMSPRGFPQRLPVIEYDTDAIVRTVQTKGRIHYAGKVFHVSKAFRGYPVALRQTTEDGILDVFFCQNNIGRINLHEQQ